MKRITANQYQTSERYYKLPKLLFESERYKNMKLEVKVVYSVLKDRLELSLSKGWIDEDWGYLFDLFQFKFDGTFRLFKVKITLHVSLK